MTIDDFLSRLRGVTKSGTGWKAHCPAHEDRKPSLSVGVGTGGEILITDHGGCAREAVVAALGLTMADLFPEKPEQPRIVATYDYRDERGIVLFQVVRYDPKDFKQRRPDPARPGQYLWGTQGVRRLLYRLPELRDQVRVIVTEGEKDVDRAWSLGLPATTASGGAKKWARHEQDYLEQLSRMHVLELVVIPHADEPGWAHARQVIRSALAFGGFTVRYLDLPGVTTKGGDLSDYLDAHAPESLVPLIDATPVLTEPLPEPGAAPAPAPPLEAPQTSLGAVHEVFHRWLGEEYEADVLDAMLAASASLQLGGDPCWLMILSGAGAAKTETVQSLEGAGALIVSMISSAGALLSGTAKRERTKDATGGLLRKVGPSGLLVIKDMTSVLAMDRSNRASVLAALREIHDGKWVREIGTDGGRTLTWEGHIGIIAACTSAWDRAHDVVATMGDRFVLVRFDSNEGREAAFRQAWKNSGHEVQMRRELAQVVGALLAQVDRENPPKLEPADERRLFQLADLATRARTGVDVDTRLDVIVANMPEMPTRFAKQLYQIVRGALALGLGLPDAMNLATRCARDSIPPLRLKVLDDLALHPKSRTQDVARRCGLLWYTAKRALDALYALNLVGVHGEDRDTTYTLRAHVNPSVIRLDDVVFDVGPESDPAPEPEREIPF